MDNLQDIFSSVLSNPEAVSKLRSLGKELGLSTGTDNTSKENTKAVQTGNPPFDMSALSSLLSSKESTPQPVSSSGLGSSLSPDSLSSITKLMPLLSSLNSEDETTVLLNSLRPFLSGEKRRRLEDAGKILRVMRILPKLKNTGIF